MSEKKHVPLRTCIGCRRKKRKEEMMWLAHSLQGVIRVDGKKPHQGRGFYLCQNLQCLQAAKRRKKGIEFLATTDFQSFLMKGFSNADQIHGGGGSE